jgi:hypothetical protein
VAAPAAAKHLAAAGKGLHGRRRRRGALVVDVHAAAAGAGSARTPRARRRAPDAAPRWRAPAAGLKAGRRAAEGARTVRTEGVATGCAGRGEVEERQMFAASTAASRRARSKGRPRGRVASGDSVVGRALCIAPNYRIGLGCADCARAHSTELGHPPLTKNSGSSTSTADSIRGPRFDMPGRSVNEDRQSVKHARKLRIAGQATHAFV